MRLQTKPSRWPVCPICGHEMVETLPNGRKAAITECRKTHLHWTVESLREEDARREARRLARQQQG